MDRVDGREKRLPASRTRLAPSKEPWQPSRNQIAALRAAILNPDLRGYRSLGRAVGLAPGTIKIWRRDPRFRQWWNGEMLIAARDYVGPALNELVRMIADPGTSDSVKVKACKVFFDGISHAVTTTEGATAVLLEAFGPAQGATSQTVHESATGKEIANLLRRIENDAALQRGADCGAVTVPLEEQDARQLTEKKARLAVKVITEAQEEERILAAAEEGKRVAGPPRIRSAAPLIRGNLAVDARASAGEDAADGETDRP